MKPEERVRAMMEAVGLDPDSVKPSDMPVIAEEIQSRCESCKSDELCEAWLRGAQDTEVNFCPNSPIFEILAKHGGHAAK